MHGVGLVRGINVGPTTRVSKEQLVAAFHDPGFRAVKTLLASGNIVFDGDQPAGESERLVVEKGILTRSGVAARVLLIDESEFRRVAEANPLVEEADDFSKLVVTYVGSDLPSDLAPPDASTLAPELVQVGTRAIYQWCPLGVSKSKLPLSFWRSISAVATARNWRTVLRIMEELDARA